MKNAQQIRELLDVIKEQRRVVAKCAEEVCSETLVDEEWHLESQCEELCDLIEKELE